MIIDFQKFFIFHFLEKMKDDVFFKSKIDFETPRFLHQILRELKSLEQLSKIFHFSLFEKNKDDIMVTICIFFKSKIDFETP